jgi:selenocysteine lyase/cysteine desulfurase
VIHTEKYRMMMVRSEATDWIYMNNAATSWPKPPEVLTAVQESLLSPLPVEGGGVTRKLKIASGQQE